MLSGCLEEEGKGTLKDIGALVVCRAGGGTA